MALSEADRKKIGKARSSEPFPKISGETANERAANVVSALNLDISEGNQNKKPPHLIAFDKIAAVVILGAALLGLRNSKKETQATPEPTTPPAPHVEPAAPAQSSLPPVTAEPKVFLNGVLTLSDIRAKFQADPQISKDFKYQDQNREILEIVERAVKEFNFQPSEGFWVGWRNCFGGGETATEIALSKFHDGLVQSLVGLTQGGPER